MQKILNKSIAVRNTAVFHGIFQFDFWKYPQKPAIL